MRVILRCAWALVSGVVGRKEERAGGRLATDEWV